MSDTTYKGTFIGDLIQRTAEVQTEAERKQSDRNLRDWLRFLHDEPEPDDAELDS